MTTSFCTCQSPSRRWKISVDANSLELDKDVEELEPLPNGLTDGRDGDGERENAPCLSEDESVQNVKKTERRARIDRVWQYYLKHNTLHGLHYVFDTKSIWRKVVWVAVLLIAGGVFFNEVKQSITLYFKYPFNTLSTVTYPNKIGLPAISICDLRDVRKTILKIPKPKRTYENNTVQNGAEPNFELSVNDVREESFSVLSDILISCSLKRGVKLDLASRCDSQNFTLFLSSEGHTCFTFNSGSNGIGLVETDNVGPGHGLHMVLNTRPLEDGKTYGGSGLKVILHQQYELPLKRVGFHVPTGYVTYVDMKKQKVIFSIPMFTIYFPIKLLCISSPRLNSCNLVLTSVMSVFFGRVNER